MTGLCGCCACQDRPAERAHAEEVGYALLLSVAFVSGYVMTACCGRFFGLVCGVRESLKTAFFDGYGRVWGLEARAVGKWVEDQEPRS